MQNLLQKFLKICRGGYDRFRPKIKNPIFWARLFGAILPILFFCYILFLNFSSFGLQKIFIINVGSPEDVKKSEFYLEPSFFISERKTYPNSSEYRELN